MRLTGGQWGGRTLRAPDGTATRPTTDRVREALFDIICHRDWGEAIGDPLTDQPVLDAFAGSGALGFDALSRGAASVTFFDKDRAAQTALRANMTSLGCQQMCHLLGCDALRPPAATTPAHLVFLDPPYNKGLIPPALIALQKAGWIAPQALIVAETAKKEPLPTSEGWEICLTRPYGDTAIHFMIAAA